jgi:uncharacterized protein YjbI with pentapeptide repeats
MDDRLDSVREETRRGGKCAPVRLALDAFHNSGWKKPGGPSQDRRLHRKECHFQWRTLNISKCSTKGLEHWNKWREEHPQVTPDLIRANLREAALSGANHSGADLRHVQLDATDLGKVNLRGANLGFAFLRDADLSGADLSDGNLFQADISQADLSGAKLIGASLILADLRRANLGHAMLSLAKILGTSLTGLYSYPPQRFDPCFQGPVISRFSF